VTVPACDQGFGLVIAALRGVAQLLRRIAVPSARLAGSDPHAARSASANSASTELRDTAQRGYDESKALIARWHGHARSLYAITRALPAPAPRRNSTRRVTLWREHKDVLVHTHIAEKQARDRLDRRTIFPTPKNYLDIYDRHGLIGRRAVLAHGVHLSEDELCRCHASGTALAHCPTSNLFLGSGLFGIGAAKDPPAARCMSGSAPISVGARVFRCSPPWAPPTRSRSSAAVR